MRKQMVLMALLACGGVEAAAFPSPIKRAVPRPAHRPPPVPLRTGASATHSAEGTMPDDGVDDAACAVERATPAQPVEVETTDDALGPKPPPLQRVPWLTADNFPAEVARYRDVLLICAPPW
jgi:hypothetical protein